MVAGTGVSDGGLLKIASRAGRLHDISLDKEGTMGNPVPTLKIILILMIVVDTFWFGERLLSMTGLNLFNWLPSSVINLVGMLGSLLMILFNVLLIALLSRVQLKPE